MVRWTLLSPENWTSNLFSRFQFILPTPVKQAQDARQRKKEEMEKNIFFAKKLSLCHKLKCSHPNIFATWWWKLKYFKLFNLAELIVSNLRSTSLGCQVIGIRKSEFRAKTQFL